VAARSLRYAIAFREGPGRSSTRVPCSRQVASTSSRTSRAEARKASLSPAGTPASILSRKLRAVLTSPLNLSAIPIPLQNALSVGVAHHPFHDRPVIRVVQRDHLEVLQRDDPLLLPADRIHEDPVEVEVILMP